MKRALVVVVVVVMLAVVAVPLCGLRSLCTRLGVAICYACVSTVLTVRAGADSANILIRSTTLR